jgi:hypothetical protein
MKKTQKELLFKGLGFPMDKKNNNVRLYLEFSIFPVAAFAAHIL